MTWGLVVLGLWLGLMVARDGFWRLRERDDDALGQPAVWPAVAAVVPARDEAGFVGRAVASLQAQDYPGDLRIIVVDDGSHDATAAEAVAAGAEVVAGVAPSPGWTGKLWALAQGIERAGPAPAYLLLTDADIVHAPDTLRRLVARAVGGGLTLVSLMARLRCDTPAERLLVPAFVWFFQLLFPFGAVNRPGPVAAAAGGVMLVDRATLAAAGGVAVVKAAIIDDCALAGVLKARGPIRLLLTDRAVSLRPYASIGELGAVIARSAYAQLGFSVRRLVGTLAGLALLFAMPPLLAIFGNGVGQVAGAAAWVVMGALFQPILRFYGRSPLWGAALPAIAAVYGWYTIISAVQVWRGSGGRWKGRAQALVRP